MNKSYNTLTEKLEDLVAGDYLTESMKELMIQQRDEVERLREGIEDAIYDFLIINEELQQHLKELIE